MDELNNKTVRGLLKALVPFVTNDQDWHEIKLSVYVKRDGKDGVFDELLIKEYPVDGKTQPFNTFGYGSFKEATTLVAHMEPHVS